MVFLYTFRLPNCAANSNPRSGNHLTSFPRFILFLTTEEYGVQTAKRSVYSSFFFTIYSFGLAQTQTCQFVITCSRRRLVVVVLGRCSRRKEKTTLTQSLPIALTFSIHFLHILVQIMNNTLYYQWRCRLFFALLQLQLHFA